MKVTKGTIVRTILTVVVLINMVLKAKGHAIIQLDEGTVMYYVETGIEIAIIGVSFWKNNSFSKKAIEADNYLKQLKDGE